MKHTHLLLAFILTFLSCMSSQTNQNKTKIDLSSEGYTYVKTIISQNKTACDTIFITDDQRQLEIYQNGKRVQDFENEFWIKYINLRRLPKCKKAQPVEMTEIKSVIYE